MLSGVGVLVIIAILFLLILFHAKIQETKKKTHNSIRKERTKKDQKETC